MNRLTEEKQIGPFASLKDKAEAKPGAFADYDCLYAHMLAVTRLKAYEDTGLTPEEIMAIKEKQADGRLLEIPYKVKVGDNVWFLLDDEYAKDITEQIGEPVRITDVSSRGFWVSDLLDQPDLISLLIPWDEVRNGQCFFTYEEAVAAAKEKYGNGMV